MSILSRLLKRDDDTAPPPAGDAARTGVTPTGEFPATADQTDANLVLPEHLEDAKGGLIGHMGDDAGDQVITTTVPAELVMADPSGGWAPERTSEWAAPPPPALTQAAAEEAFRKLLASSLAAPAGAGAGASNGARAGNGAAAGSEADRQMAAVRAAFEQVAVAQLLPVRNLMLEVRWGGAEARWIEQVTPPLAALRRVLATLLDASPGADAGGGGEAAANASAPAANAGVPALAAALDRFTGALGEVVRAGDGMITGPARAALLEAYQPLAAQLPAAFAVDGERARREPLIVESLLQQVPGVDPLACAKLAAVGLSRLENLFEVSAEEIAYVAAVPAALAAAVVEKVREFQRSLPAGVTGDAAVRRPLEALVSHLDACHQGHERASTGWSEQDVGAKRHARRDRERAWLALRAALARLGEVDLVLALDKLPYGRRIEELRHFVLGGAPPPPGAGNRPKPTNGGTGDGRAHA